VAGLTRNPMRLTSAFRLPADLALAIGHQRRVEAGVAVAGHRQPDRADLAAHRLGGDPVAVVARAAPNRVTLVVGPPAAPICPSSTRAATTLIAELCGLLLN
jgi:hypothetical protein